MRFKKYINEVGFDKYPEGWNRDSVIKFAKTLTKETGKGPTEHGFFDACVLKMEKHFGEGAKGFCASVKDEAYGHTYWRGKDKPKKEIPKAKASKELK